MSEQELPQGWVQTTLGEILPIEYGKGLVQERREPGNVPVYGSSGIVGYHSHALTTRPTLIIGRKGSVGRAFYSPGPCWPIDTVYFAQATPNTVLPFFRYQCDWLKLDHLDKSTAVPGLSRDDYNAVKVAIPPLPEQRRIVAAIEEQFTRLDAGVAALRSAQARLKRYRASVLKAAVEGRMTVAWRAANPDAEPAEALLGRILVERRARWEAGQRANGKDTANARYQEPQGPEAGVPGLPEGWRWGITDQVLEFVTSGSRGWAQYYSEEGATFIRMGNLDHDTVSLDLSSVQLVKPADGAEGTRTRVRQDDILISITADLGMVALVPADLGEAYINQHIALARPLDARISAFLAWFLASENGNRELLTRQRGATKIGLGLDDIRSVLFPLPPLAEQAQIVAAVERRLSVIAAIETTIAANLKRAERLRQSILAEAFAGRLVPQDPADEPASALLARIGAGREATETARASGAGRGKRRVAAQQLAFDS